MSIDTTWLAALVLVALLLRLAVVVHRDIAEFARFRAAIDSVERIAFFRKWLRSGALLYTLVPLAVLAILGRFDVLLAVPPELADARDALVSHEPATRVQADDVTLPFVFGFLFAFLLGVILVVVITKVMRGFKGGTVDFEPLLPRAPSEQMPVLALALHAGVGEELFFRAMMPLLLTLVGLPAIPALLLSAAIFGVVHLYQGWFGVALTAVVGAGLSYVYLKSGSIWMPVALHMFININALFVRPAIARLFGGHAR